MYRALSTISFLVAAFTTVSVHAQMRQSDGKIALSTAGVPWEVVFPKGTWLVHVERQPLPGTALFFFSNRNNLFSTFAIEPSPSCQSAPTCRTEFLKKPTLNVKRDLQSVSYINVNDFDVARFFVSEIDGAATRQLFFSAHHVRDGYGIHIGVWGMSLDLKDEKLMLEFVNGISVQSK
jgi:hypothetical protein